MEIGQNIMRNKAIFQEKTMYFKPHFSHTKHEHFLLKFALIDREMFNLYEYNNLINLGQQ